MPKQTSFFILASKNRIYIYDGTEIYGFIGIYLLSQLCTIINKNNCGLYKDDGLMIQKYINGQQIDQLCKKIIKIFKEIGFKIDTETNLKIVDFLHVTFNLINGSYKPYKKPNDALLSPSLSLYIYIIYIIYIYKV